MAELTQQLLSNAYILPYSTADPNVFNFVHADLDIVNRNYREPKLRQICNHVLSSGTYTLNTCSRCLGNGYYYDININEHGTVDQVYGVDKLGQDLEKITLTQVGENKFHLAYGTILTEVHGELTTSTQESLLRQSIIEAVYRLKMLQQLEIENGQTFTPEELIDRIDKINFYNTSDPRQLGYRVFVVTVAGNSSVIEGNITLTI